MKKHPGSDWKWPLSGFQLSSTALVSRDVPSFRSALHKPSRCCLKTSQSVYINTTTRTLIYLRWIIGFVGSHSGGGKALLTCVSVRFWFLPPKKSQDDPIGILVGFGILWCPCSIPKHASYLHIGNSLKMKNQLSGSSAYGELRFTLDLLTLWQGLSQVNCQVNCQINCQIGCLIRFQFRCHKECQIDCQKNVCMNAR